MGSNTPTPDSKGKGNCIYRKFCSGILKERNRKPELREPFGLRPVGLVTKKDRLRLFGHVESKDYSYWVMEVGRELYRDDI